MEAEDLNEDVPQENHDEYLRILGLSDGTKLNKLGMSIARHTVKESDLGKVFDPLARGRKM
jgi:hypothetical protein